MPTTRKIVSSKSKNDESTSDQTGSDNNDVPKDRPDPNQDTATDKTESILPTASQFQALEDFIKKSFCDIQHSLNTVILQQQDVTERLACVERKQNEVIKGLEWSDKEVCDIKFKQNEQATGIEQIQSQLKGVISENIDLKNRLLNQERYSGEFNLRFGGISEKADENCMNIINSVITKDLGIQNVQVENAHRVGKKREGQTRHVIAKFILRPQRRQVLTTAKSVLKDKDTFVTEDLIPEDRQKKNQLREIMAKYYSEGRKVRFSRGRLFVDGKEVTDP